MIAQQTGGNCLVRGFTTMRLALGYAEAKPEAYKDMEPGGKTFRWILENAPAWFPEHKVKVWCSKMTAEKAENSDAFDGDYIPAFFDWDAHIAGFGYSAAGEEHTHFVVGAPTLFGDMVADVVVCVELAKAAE